MKKIPVVLDGGEPTVSVRLFDATLREVRLARNCGRTRATLAPGAYVVRFVTSAWRSEQTFLVRPGTKRALNISPPPDSKVIIDSAAPLHGTTTYRSEDAVVVTEASRAVRSTVAEGPAHGSLLIVVRKRPMRAGRCTASTFSQSPWGDIELHSADGQTPIELRQVESTGAKGIACAGISAAPGPYQLRISTGPAHFTVQYVFVVPRMQTQIFIVDQSATNAPKPWASAKVSIHLVKQSAGFDPAARDARIFEELLNLLAKGIRPSFGAGLRSLIARSAHPLAGVAYWMLQCDDKGLAPISGRPSIVRLCESLPDVADAVVLRVAARRATARRSAVNAAADLRYPPMLTRAWDLVLGAEEQGALRVPPGSPLARLGVNALGATPWLRFRDHGACDLGRVAGAEAEENSSLGFSGRDFELFVESLRARVADDVSARVQFSSTHFSVAERRLIGVLCPSIDTLWLRIMEATNRRANEALPSEDSVVRALSLPRASVMLVAAAAVEKLTRLTILPSEDQLDEFVRAESNNDIVTFEPLNSLKARGSGIAHVVEGRDYSLLAILYLFYHWREPHIDDETTHGRIAAMLNRLGFVRVPGDGAPGASDIAAALERAREILRSFFDGDEQGHAIWESVRVELVARQEYRSGGLCRVRRSSIGKGAAEPCQQLWEKNPMAYSAALWPPDEPGSQPRAFKLASTGPSRAEYFHAITTSASRPWDAGEIE